MRTQRSRKPVHACYTCLLNRGDYCWLYRYPRGQWSGPRQCRAFQNEDMYEQYRQWLKQPTVKTRKELRREFFRTKKRDPAGQEGRERGRGLPTDLTDGEGWSER